VELLRLTPEDFRLDAEPPAVALSARDAKNGRAAVQPLPPDVVGLFRDYLRDKPAGWPVWPGRWHGDGDAAEMLRIDLEAAGVPYAVGGPDGPLYADFHALRHTFIRLLDKGGATLKGAMQLARHSDPKLTMAVFGRAQLHDRGEAVRRLPTLLTYPADHTREQVLQATGTDPVCTGFAQTDDTGREGLRLVETNRLEGAEKTAGLNPLSGAGVEASCDPLSVGESSIPDRSRTCNLRLRRRFPQPPWAPKTR
jgi:hypothetical protein